MWGSGALGVWRPCCDPVTLIASPVALSGTEFAVVAKTIGPGMRTPQGLSFCKIRGWKTESPKASAGTPRSSGCWIWQAGQGRLSCHREDGKQVARCLQVGNDWWGWETVGWREVFLKALIGGEDMAPSTQQLLYSLSPQSPLRSKPGGVGSDHPPFLPGNWDITTLTPHTESCPGTWEREEPLLEENFPFSKQEGPAR